MMRCHVSGRGSLLQSHGLLTRMAEVTRVGLVVAAEVRCVLRGWCRQRDESLAAEEDMESLARCNHPTWPKLPFNLTSCCDLATVYLDGRAVHLRTW